MSESFALDKTTQTIRKCSDCDRGGISACLADSDEFELDKNGKPKDLITFAADPVLYDQSNWNAFICWNLINEIVKLSMKEQEIDINKIFDDIKQKALRYYKNANIKDLATQLDTSISDIKKYDSVLDLSTFLKLFSELKSEIKNGNDYTDCIVAPSRRKLAAIDLSDVKTGEIRIRGSGESITQKYKDYTMDWWIRRAYGLNYPMTGEFFNTHNKFFLDLEFDETKKVWRTSTIESFKKIRYIQPNEQKAVIGVLYDDENLKRSMPTIKQISKFMDEGIPKKWGSSDDAAKAVVGKIINDNKQLRGKKKELTEVDFYALFGRRAWRDKDRDMLERDLRAFLEPIGIELDEEVF